MVPIYTPEYSRYSRSYDIKSSLVFGITIFLNICQFRGYKIVLFFSFNLDFSHAYQPFIYLFCERTVHVLCIVLLNFIFVQKIFILTKIFIYNSNVILFICMRHNLFQTKNCFFHYFYGNFINRLLILMVLNSSNF